MKVIEKDTIGDVWQSAFDFILKEGKKIQDEDQELIEFLHLFLIVNKPDEKDLIILNKEDPMKLWMQENFTQIKRIPELNDAWSYGWRLFNFQGVNQVDWVIEHLKKKPETKSATISMLQSAGTEAYIPCVSLLDFKIRNNQLWLTATCRSLDFGKKALYNFSNLAKIAQNIANRLQLKMFKLFIHIISAHVYKEDLDKSKIIKE